MTPMQQRSLIRNIHLIISGLIGWALYGPSETILTIAQWAAFPALILSGLWLWLGPRLTRRWKAR